MEKFYALARSPLGRLLAMAVGLGAVTVLVVRAGPEQVWSGVSRAPVLFLILFLLEVGVAGTESWASLLLYGAERNKIPFAEKIRISAFCYAVIGVAPFGRAAGEATRAAMVTRYIGFPLAAASGARAQALSLLGNSLISVPCAIAVLIVHGPPLLFCGVVAFIVIWGVMGGGLLLAGKRSRLGARIGKYFRGGLEVGSAVDMHLESKVGLAAPLSWIMVSRCLRTTQRAVLLIGVGAISGVVPSLVSESINLVASAIGDAIPAQVGVTEFFYSIAAKTLGVSPSDAIAMALLVHMAQILCVGLGFLSPLLAPPPKPVVETAPGTEKAISADAP